MAWQSWKARWQKRWKSLRAARPGQRFEDAYREQRRADEGKSWALRAVKPLLALVSFAIGVVLAFIPGPAILFFAITAVLLASLSLRVARWLDRCELFARAAWRSARVWFRRKRGPVH